MNDFEDKLQRQALRQIPPGWREEILTGAMSRSEAVPPARHRFWRLSLNARLSAVLWPCPQAWAGLAAAWIILLAVNFSIRDKTPLMAEKSPPPSREVIAALRNQQKLLAELLSQPADVRSEPAALLPAGPRSERQNGSMMAALERGELSPHSKRGPVRATQDSPASSA